MQSGCILTLLLADQKETFAIPEVREELLCISVEQSIKWKS